MSEFRRRLMMGAALAVPPKPTGYIKFEDPEVAKICVQNFSSDGVGVTYEDASKVTNIAAKFQSKNITKFNELQYFANVDYKVRALFAQCKVLEEITYPNTAKMIGEVNHYLNEKLQYVRGVDNVEIIGNYAFQGCKSLSSINFPSLSELLGTRNFTGCTNLKEVSELGNLKVIPEACFANCGINKVILPKTLIKIDTNAFMNCPITLLISYAENPPAYATGVSSDLKNSIIYVPDASTEAYKTAPNWSTYADKIKPLSTYVEQ